jgi:co-chaperonin GroES (HSP10)
MARVAVLEALANASNPKLALKMKVGDLSKVELLSNRVLIGIYIAPEKTKGGIIRTTGSLKEDVYQATVGLVLKKGVTAFQDEKETNTYFHGQDVKEGDWVVFRPGDARRVQINGVDCRFIEDTLIDMVIDDPEIITHDGK